MAKVNSHSSYKWYLATTRPDLGLPDLEANCDGNYYLYVGEVYCRAAGCEHDHQFNSTNALRKHYEKEHSNMTFDTRPRGGRPSLQMENEAITFYRQVQNAYDERMVNETPELPDVPFKRDRTVNCTEMRRKVRELGYTVPCEACKETEARKKDCCKSVSQDYCDHFELFKPLNTEEERLQQEGLDSDRRTEFN